MSQISTCPRCRLPISLPEKLSPAAQVKCPLCSAEYTLQEALDQVPPMLIVLDPGPLEAAVTSEAAVGAVLDAGATGLLPEVQFPDTDREGAGLPHFADDGDVNERDVNERDVDEDAEGRLSLGDEVPDESGARIGGALRDEESGGGFDFDHDTDDDAPRAATTRRRSQRTSSGGFGEMVKAVMGAMMGIVIGYYILLWFGKDPMQIRPFLHTYLPTWLVP